MNLSRRIEGSICGTRLLQRPSPGPPPRPACCARYAIAGERGRPRTSDRPYPRRAGPSLVPSSRISHLITPRLRRLTLHTTCPARTNDGFFTPHTQEHGRVFSADAECTARTNGGAAEDQAAADAPPSAGAPGDGKQPSKEELLAIVGQYDPNDTVSDHLKFIRDPYLRGYAQPNGPVMKAHPIPEDPPAAPKREQQLVPTKEEKIILRNLRNAVVRRLGNPVPEDHASSAEVYAEYAKLDDPRLALQNHSLRHGLLRSLSQGVKRNSKNMLRYLSVFGTVKTCGYPLTPAQWNAAMSFASRHVGSSTEAEVEAALNIWREMEHAANIKANGITFNILFDVATKAGNFTLAEMLYREMENRQIPFNRYHNVSLIYFFGLLMDADGVRAAYREMVESGDVIDKVVLNCVIASLLRCGDEDGAERVYERMKTFHGNKRWRDPQAYSTHKAVTKVLIMFARVARKHPELRAGFQVAAPMSPDLQTYRVLVRHYGIRLGRINEVARFLDEMKYFRIPLHGSIFLALFQAFATHGSASAKDWGPERLFGVWEALLSALDHQTDGMYVDTWIVCWVLRAFAKLGQHSMIIDVYAELGARWNLDQEKKEFLVQFLHGILKKHKIPIPFNGTSLHT